MPASFFGLARIHLRQEKYQQALREIDAALRLAPNSKNAHFIRGRVLLKVGRREEAEKEMATAQQLSEAATDKVIESTSMNDKRVRNPELAQPPQ
jgi:Flp pilus assembly protein TadD